MENDVVEQPNEEVVAETAAKPEEGQQEQPKPKGDVPEWAVRRFGELTAARKDAERRAAEIAAERDALRQQVESGQQPAGNTVEELANARAESIAEQRLRQRAMQDRIQSIDRAGREEFGAEYDRATENLAMAGVGSEAFIQALAEIPNAEKVVQFLGQPDNLEEASRLASLSPVRMAVELMKLAPKAAKAFSKPVSSAPAPITPISGGGSADSAEPKVGTPEWYAWRNKTARRKW
jgi:hypothetical protein